MKKLFVIGHPVSHSLSPDMHNAALKELNLDREYHYEKLDIQKEDLKDFITKIRTREVFGANVTIPHKIEVIRHMDELTTQAQEIGAVNTIYFENNKVIGHNTDGIGCIKAFEEYNINLKNKRIVIIGAGGASRAVCNSLATKTLEKIILLNIDLEMAKTLADEVTLKTKKLIGYHLIENSDIYLRAADIIINCTPMGMKGELENEIPIKENLLDKSQIIMDLVYNPLWTKFMLNARDTGCTTIDGTKMLVYQGAAAFEIWTGQKAPIQVMQNKVYDTIEEMPK
jgi:shikimate dehydrogenase